MNEPQNQSTDDHKEIERLRDDMAKIAKAVLSANVTYPSGCNLNEPGKLVELVRYLASRAEDAESADAQHVCGEAYQAVGLLANMAGVFHDPAVQALLDNLSDAAEGNPLTHDSVLPFYPVGWQDKVKVS